jgi:hypothetical protein
MGKRADDEHTSTLSRRRLLVKLTGLFADDLYAIASSGDDGLTRSQNVIPVSASTSSVPLNQRIVSDLMSETPQMTTHA